MNTELDSNTSITIDPSTPFCARTYFEGLRKAGVRPSATSHAGRKCNGHWVNDGAACARAMPWHAWARERDPEQVQIRDYVLALLDKYEQTGNPDNFVTLHLGICDEDAVPEVTFIPAPASS